MADMHLRGAGATLCNASVGASGQTLDVSAVDCPECLWVVLRELRRQESTVLALLRTAEAKARVQVIKPEVQRG